MRRTLPATESCRPQVDHIHVSVVGGPGWIARAPPTLRGIADIHQPESSPDYRLIVLGFDISSLPDAESYFADMEGWVYSAGLRRQKNRPPRAGFRKACQALLNDLRRGYLDRGVGPDLSLRQLGVQVAYVGD